MSMRNDNKKIIKIVIIIIAAVVVVVLAVGAVKTLMQQKMIRDLEAARDYDEIKKVRTLLCNEGHIVHAGGYIENENGETVNYTSSMEAINNCYEQGNRFCEIDFLISTDGELVCAHAWDQLYREDGTQVENAVSLEEFKNCRMENSFTPMSGADLIEFMRTHEDIYIITDIKDDNIGGCKKLAEACPDLKERFIIQIYHENEGYKIEELGFQNIIYTLYRTQENERTEAALKAAAKKHYLIAFTIKKAWIDENIIKVADSVDTPVFTHTVNEPEEMRTFSELGVTGFYSDLVEWDESYNLPDDE